MIWQDATIKIFLPARRQPADELWENLLPESACLPRSHAARGSQETDHGPVGSCTLGPSQRWWPILPLDALETQQAGSK